MVYRHQQYVSQDAWYLRYYNWLYGADPLNADFCKLFWATLFVVPATILRVLALPLRKPVIAFIDWLERRELESDLKITSDEEILRIIKKDEERRARKVAARRKWNARWNKISALCSRVADRVVVFFEYKPVRYAIRTVLFAGAAALSCLLVYLAATNLRVVAIGLAAALGIAVALGLLILIVAFLRENKRVAASASYTGEFIKVNTQGFFGALKMGAKGIKSRTCPQIIVVDEKGNPVVDQSEAPKSQHQGA